jgi:hypothetical protein
MHLPAKVAIIHCPGHQKERDSAAKGRQMTDLTAKQATQGNMILVLKMPVDITTLEKIVSIIL